MTEVMVVDCVSDTLVQFDEEKLSESLKELCKGLNTYYINIQEVISKIVTGIPSKVTKSELVTFTAETLASLTTTHPDYSILAARVEIRQLHKRLNGISFTENLEKLRNLKGTCGTMATNDGKDSAKRRKAVECKRTKHLISPNFYQVALKYKDVLDKAIDHTKDYNFTYFGWKTLCKSYLIKHDNREVHETPQFLFMRVALAIHGPFADIESVLETYKLMSEKYFIHASPTLFNAGTVNSYLSSCFLIGMIDDSIDGIYRTLHKTALISKASGGVGIHVSNIRGSGAYISGSNGTSNGLVPMLRVFNNTARYVDQGGNKRPGAFCIYLEPWHCDVLDFLQLRKNHGKEELRARDLFYALWIPDLFMRRVEEDSYWSLFSPDEAPGLADVYGDEFDSLYERYETDLVPVQRIKAQKLWSEIIQSQTETGVPFMLYKDSCNKKSNQKNLGTIKSSNLCCEIIEYSSPEETAVCNLASVALPTFVTCSSTGIPIFDYKKLHRVVKVVTRNLDRVIDICDYPVPEAKYSNMKNRPLAIGVQGLADLFMMLHIPFNSEVASKLNKHIFETIYHAAVEQSIELAEEHGCYESFTGSPASQGLLQFDLWGLDEKNYEFLYKDWGSLKHKIQFGCGLRNSLLVGPMPTASTSQILGFTESFEPLTSNIYNRRVLSGEYTIVNSYMVQDLCNLGVWSEKLKNRIILDNGSIQNIEGIPKATKEIYKTVWEIPQRSLIDLSSERAPFIDQSQSLNLYLREPTMGKLTSMHFYGWKKGLKTGMYYLRTQAASSAIQFTLNQENTLLGSVSVAPGSKELSFLPAFIGKYPSNTTGASDNKSVTSSCSSTDDERNGFSQAPEKEDVYGIHDTTPLSCEITEGGTCESCSG